MTSYLIPLARQELLYHMLQTGGRAVCEMTRPAETIHATFDVELTEEHAVVSAECAGQTKVLKLRRRDRANHLHLRDLLQSLANRPDASPAPSTI